MKRIRFGALLVFTGLVCFSFSSFAFAERLQTSDLTYLGAFRLPETSVYEYACNAGTECDLSYRPDGDQSGGSDGYSGSLFFSNRFTVAEIRIPAPRKDSNIGSLNLATQIQSTPDVVGGRGCASCDYMGGIAYSPPRGSQATPKLYWTSYEYYNTDSTDYNSIGWSEINLSSLNAQGSWHVGPPFSSGGQAYHGNKYGDYIFFADQTWADTYTGGRSLLVGRFREGGTYNGSSGPVLTAIAPWQDGNPPTSGTSLSAVPLMYFANNPSNNWNEFRILNDLEQTYYGAKSKWNGGAWVQRGSKKAIIIVGSLATFDNNPNPVGCTQTETGNGCKNDPDGYGPHCYGFGYSDCPGSIATSSDKGIHAGPYKPRFLFIDPDELAQVAQGTKQPNSIDAYTSYDPSGDYSYTDTTLGGQDNQLGGVAYDQANGFLYMMQPMAYRPGAPYPVIHVYQISGTSTPDTQPPTSPTSLSASSPSQSSISVSWTASTDNIAVTGYIVERCQGTGCSTFTQVGTPTSSPFTDTGLTPNTFYNYHVRATDAALNLSGWSNVVGTTTQSATFSSCNTVTPGNFSDSAYNGYGAPYDVFAGNAQLIDAKCIASDTRTIQATIGKVNDTTRIVYTKGYYYDPGTSNWTQFTGTCTGLLNGEWCAGLITATVTDPDISTASSANPTYLVGMTCSMQGGNWKCGCRDTACANFSWQVQGAGR